MWADVGDLDVLVAEALDLVLPLLLIEADLGRSHDLTAALARSVERYLEITERVVGSASAAIKLAERHGTRSDDRDDRHCALLAFTRDSDLITGGTYRGDAALILLFQGAAKGVRTFILYQLRKILDFFIGRVLRDAEIKCD